ncbi:hypothetical protein [Glycomyces sp. NRRL B-16210]|uniref:hypothetical protein n=1 Tax=Glycomyces sp. NRRL B-16210 TaxID=1463821 RepID=UPI0004C10232|nr:hypothetical protein [Glycomyces sp. NRRL B-16210]
MTRISPESETSLLDAFEQELRTLLPATWTLEAHREARLEHQESARRADLVLTIATPAGTHVALLVEVKHHADPRTVLGAVAQLESLATALQDRFPNGLNRVVVSNFLSPRARELLLEHGVGWYDASGNMRLELDEPAVFISRSGAERDPSPRTDHRRLKSLRGPSAARVVRALLDGAPDTRVRPLAEHAGVGTATSARVLAYLAEQHLVDRDEQATVRRVHKQSLAQAWARDYGVTTTNHSTSVLVPRGLDWLIEQLAERNLPHVLGGSAALRHYLPERTTAVTPLSLLAVYSSEVPRLKRELRLRDAGRTANALLLEPFDRLVLRGARKDGGHTYTAPSQTVVDLLTSPGRGPEEAGQLIEVLAEQDEEWTL